MLNSINEVSHSANTAVFVHYFPAINRTNYCITCSLLCCENEHYKGQKFNHINNC